MSSASIKRVQEALAAKGYDPGEADGVWGRRSIAALKKFQADKGLDVDGIPGPLSRAALLPDDSPSPAAREPDGLVWLEEARRLVGTKEIRGPGDNPVIIGFAEGLNIDYSDDDIAWCGLFAAHCIGATLTEEPLPGGPLGARNWLRFGQPTKPRLGAVLVFWRGAKAGKKGHVGFYYGEDTDAFHVLGGNQSDMVNVTRIGKSRLLDARWPITASGLQSSAVTVDSGGVALSHDER